MLVSVVMTMTNNQKLKTAKLKNKPKQSQF